jgi:hypothetical protein
MNDTRLGAQLLGSRVYVVKEPASRGMVTIPRLVPWFEVLGPRSCSPTSHSTISATAGGSAGGSGGVLGRQARARRAAVRRGAVRESMARCGERKTTVKSSDGESNSSRRDFEGGEGWKLSSGRASSGDGS